MPKEPARGKISLFLSTNMNKNFVIYIDRLRDGQTLKIDEVCPTDFLEIHEDELSFLEPVTIQGKAYLADDHLVLQLDIRAQFVMPCSICNEKATLPIEIKNFYYVVPVEEIPTHMFDYSELLREEILLQVPTFAECQGGKCPERTTLTPYLKKEDKLPASLKKDHVHYPFADL